MASIRPYPTFHNALAGPSKLPQRPRTAACGILQQRGSTPALQSQSRPIYTRRGARHTSGLASIGESLSSERAGRKLRPAIFSIFQRQCRQFTSTPPTPPPPTATPPYHPLLAAAPLPASLSSDPIDPSTPTSLLEPLIALLLSSPLPAGLTILLLTFTFRSAVTLPATIWQRRRMKRTKEIVRPAMKALNERLAGVVAKECRAKGMDYEGYKKELKSQLAVHQSALHKKHSTHPLPTMLLPLFVHVPLIITLSLTIRRTIEAPFSPWAAESWWWLQHLGEVDPTMILPIAGGIVGMMNAEVIGRRNKDLGEAMEIPAAGGPVVQTPAEPASRAPVVVARTASSAGPRPPTPRPPTLPSHLTKPAAPTSRPLSTTATSLSSTPPTSRINRKPKPATPSPRPATPTQRPSPGSRSPSSPNSHLQPIQPVAEQSKELDKSRLTSKLFTNAMRCGAVLFIPIAMQVPAALALYWTGSMMFTLVQNLTLDWLDAKEKRTAAGMP